MNLPRRAFLAVTLAFSLTPPPAQAQEAGTFPVDLRIVSLSPEAVPAIFPAGLAGVVRLDEATMQRLNAAIAAKRAVLVEHGSKEIAFGKKELFPFQKSVGPLPLGNSGGGKNVGLWIQIRGTPVADRSEILVDVSIRSVDLGTIAGPAAPGPEEEPFYRVKESAQKLAVARGSHTLLAMLPPTPTDGEKNITLHLLSIPGPAAPAAPAPAPAKEGLVVYAELYALSAGAAEPLKKMTTDQFAIKRLRANREAYLGAIQVCGGEGRQQAESVVEFVIPKLRNRTELSNMGIVLGIERKPKLTFYLSCTRLVTPYTADDLRTARKVLAQPPPAGVTIGDKYEPRLLYSNMSGPLPEDGKPMLVVIEGGLSHRQPDLAAKVPVIVAVITATKF